MEQQLTDPPKKAHQCSQNENIARIVVSMERTRDIAEGLEDVIERRIGAVRSELIQALNDLSKKHDERLDNHGMTLIELQSALLKKSGLEGAKWGTLVATAIGAVATVLSAWIASGAV